MMQAHFTRNITISFYDEYNAYYIDIRYKNPNMEQNQ